mmetsp:Transcript_37841/g.82376  ORF Transcript_37841/g.82376 Transcript_37841/m.82376 type:complete len:183 (+) Transcript_37841:3-551(+)
MVPEDSITYGKGGDIVGYKIMDDGGVRLVKENGKEVIPTSSVESSTTPLVVAADGIYSTFRQCLATDSCELDAFDERQNGVRYNKRVNIKAIVESELGDDHAEPNHTVSFFTPGGGTACFAGPAGEKYTYWAISVADADDECEIIRLASNASTDKASMKDALLKRLRGLNEPLCDFAVEKLR